MLDFEYRQSVFLLQGYFVVLEQNRVWNDIQVRSWEQNSPTHSQEINRKYM